MLNLGEFVFAFKYLQKAGYQFQRYFSSPERRSPEQGLEGSGEKCYRRLGGILTSA
jgi:hypothetical protein